MRSRWIVLIVVVVLSLLSACGSEDTSDSTPAGSDGGDQNASSGSTDENPSVEIVDSGFGQNDFTAVGIVIVTNEGEDTIGEYVTVSVNFLDATQRSSRPKNRSNRSTGSDRNSSSRSRRPHTSTAKTRSPASSLQYRLATTGRRSRPRPPCRYWTRPRSRRASMAVTASFAFTNETDTDLKSLRVGVACYDAANKIIGGTSTYPNLAPAGKTIRIDVDPTVCKNPHRARRS